MIYVLCFRRNNTGLNINKSAKFSPACFAMLFGVEMSGLIMSYFILATLFPAVSALSMFQLSRNVLVAVALGMSV